MKHFYFLAIIFLLPTGMIAREVEYQNSVYAWFKQGYTQASVEAKLEELSWLKIKEITPGFPDSKTERLQNTVIIECDCDSRLLAEVLNAKFSDDLFAEPVPAVVPLYEPNDLNIHNSWPSCGKDLPNYHLNLINAQEAWDYSQGSSNVKIAIIDQGFNPNHPDFINADGTSQVVFWDGAPTPPTHGTFVAGCAAASTDNGTGISGIGFNSKLMLYSGIGNYNALLAATYSGAKVINLSWGGMGSSQTQQIVINEVYNNDVVVVAAAGNGDWGLSWIPYYPASYNHVISVTSVGPNDNHSHDYLHQNDGCKKKTMLHQHNAFVDISAPGYEILSTFPGGNYGFSSGTSFASPIVAGTIGLMLAANPDLTPDQVEAIIKCTAVNVDNVNSTWSGLMGAGRLNAGNAVKMAFKEYESGKLSIQLNDNYHCESGGVLVESTVSGGVEPYFYTWNGVPGNSNHLITSDGTYIVEVTDGACLKVTDTVVVNNTDQPLSMTASVDARICEGDYIVPADYIIVSGGSGSYQYNLNWKSSAVSMFGSMMISSDEVLSVKVVDQTTGCEVEDELEVTLSTDCDGQTTTLDNADLDLSTDPTSDNQIENSNSVNGVRSITMFPNPFVSGFKVMAEGYSNATIRVFDMIGKQLSVSTFSHSAEVDLTREASGIYLISVQDSKGQIIHQEKLVKR